MHIYYSTAAGQYSLLKGDMLPLITPLYSFDNYLVFWWDRLQQNHPMPLSWNEIKSKALLFTQEWKDEVSEDAEAKSFWDDFFNVFGISTRRVATFEQQ